MPQFFKGDTEELKYYECLKGISDTLSADKTQFFTEAFNCFELGDLLFENSRSPLANAIKKDVFRECFSTIFDSFLVAGSFESYLTVFRKIFGDDVQVTFTVPAPGKLTIDIVATGVLISDFIVREIIDGSYVFDEIIDSVGDTIVFQGVKGLESQYELEQVLNELVPDGIFTQISLTLGGA